MSASASAKVKGAAGGLSAPEVAAAVVASRSLVVPYAARFVSGGAPLPSAVYDALKPLGGGAVLWGQPSRVAAEAVEALSHIARRGTFEWVARMGAPRQLFIDPARGGISQGRVWDQPAWDTLSLPFSGESITLLIALHQLQRPDLSQGQDPLNALRALTLSQDGDLLLHALVYERLLKDFIKATPPAAREAFCARNPLCAFIGLEPPQNLPDLEDLAARLRALLRRPALAALWPWLARHIAQRWLAQEGSRWPDQLNAVLQMPTQGDVYTQRSTLRDEQRHKFLERLSYDVVRIEALFEAATGAGSAPRDLSLLLPLLHYGARQPLTDRRRGLPYTELVQALCRRTTLEERGRHLNETLKLIGLPLRLAALARSYRALHPLEREPEHSLFLSVYDSEPKPSTSISARLSLFEGARAAIFPEIG